METRQLMKMLIGAVAVTAVVIGISALIPSKAKADMDSDQRNPGKDKADTVVVIEQKVIEFGTAMTGWAIAFGHDASDNANKTMKAFLDDVEKIKKSEFVQYQVASWDKGKQDLSKTKESIVALPVRIKEGTSNLWVDIGNALGAVFGGPKNDR